MVQFSHPYVTIEKTVVFTIWTFVGKVMSLLFSMLSRASLVAQMVKNLPAVQETWVLSLWGKILWRRAAPSSILAWRIPWTEEPGGLQSMGLQRVGATKHSTGLS